jgi:hypothetical protein
MSVYGMLVLKQIRHTSTIVHFCLHGDGERKGCYLEISPCCLYSLKE